MIIDKSPFDEYIILFYDDVFKKEMTDFVTNFLTEEGFVIRKYRKFVRDEIIGMSPPQDIGIILLFKNQTTKYPDDIFIR